MGPPGPVTGFPLPRLSITNWLVFVVETLCVFCNVGTEVLNMVQIRGGQICHKARKHHKILGAKKANIKQIPYWRPTNTGR
jgi:hypothetical protein